MRDHFCTGSYAAHRHHSLLGAMLSLVFFCAGNLSGQSLPARPLPSADTAQTQAAAISGTAPTSSFQDSPTSSGLRDGRGHAGMGSGTSFNSTGPKSTTGSATLDDLLADSMRYGANSIRQGGARPLDFGSLFDMGSKFSQDISRDLNAKSGSAASAILDTLPRLQQFERNGLNLPLGSSAGKFDFSYRDQLGQGANAMGAGLGRGSAQASFSSTASKDSLFRFSASAMFGGAGGAGFHGSSTGNTSFGSDSSATSGMFSMGSGSGMGAGIGSSGGFSAGSMHGGMSSFGSGMNNSPMGTSGNHSGAHSESGPTISLKLTFK